MCSKVHFVSEAQEITINVTKMFLDRQSCHLSVHLAVTGVGTETQQQVLWIICHSVDDHESGTA